MPLDKQHVTRASRVMLPTYVVFFAALGTNYLATSLARLLESPGLAYAHTVASLRVWGVLFLVSAAVMAVSLLAGRREWFRFALVLCGLSMAVFAVALAVAVFAGEASPAGWVWPAFVVAACAASYRSLTAQEGR